MKFPKNVSRFELKNSLTKSIKYNDEAIDYISNEISKYENLFKYNDEDEEVKSTLNILKYIDFSLRYLDRSYRDSLRKVGGFIK